MRYRGYKGYKGYKGYRGGGTGWGLERSILSISPMRLAHWYYWKWHTKVPSLCSRACTYTIPLPTYTYTIPPPTYTVPSLCSRACLGPASGGWYATHVIYIGTGMYMCTSTHVHQWYATYGIYIGTGMYMCASTHVHQYQHTCTPAVCYACHLHRLWL